MHNDAFQHAQTASLVLTGWLLVVLCCYWQYRILQPYVRSLLWAAICSTTLRRYWPKFTDLASSCAPSRLIPEAAEPAVQAEGG
eukprot:CAMPEP_0198560006 /NCGR_PEP_ID=MMETSP1462-20131121/93286_1 /TAXON_ID=1333877 /ORGANISM="Brandtodinium nutriculum, Strain RCC3387" /LENGTH=83 /DNA_ID=CAMNT_0044290861 /DNA_START=1 /DNA_END=249 /DNA_ORIENTATION=+